MKVKLSALNRLSILGLLSKKGDFTTLTIIEQLRKELSFTQEEYDEIGFKPLPGGKIEMNEATPKEFEFEHGSVREVLLEEVKTQLRDKEKAKTLELDYLSLYKVLMLEEQKEEKPELKIVAKPKPKSAHKK